MVSYCFFFTYFFSIPICHFLSFGVYYEAGFALGLDIPVIRTCRKDRLDKVHFDTKQVSHVLWQTSEDLRRNLEDHILATAPLRS